ncbi:MAG: hypothetical protein M0R46_11385 [Candidatus Muirbacterium halophilum]|nr:hypothetical protein [Candidatus Muirbacterium halophilum]
MIKILLIITALVIFWALFGKWIMKLLNFSLKVAFRVIAIIIGILLVLSLSTKAQTVTYDATSIWSNVEKDQTTKIIDSLVIETSRVDTTTYEKFWANRDGRTKQSFVQYSEEVDVDTTEYETISDEELKVKIKSTYNNVSNFFDQVVESDEFKDTEKDVIDFSKKSITTIGKYSHIIYIEGKKYYKNGSEWFNEGWEKVEDPRN